MYKFTHRKPDPLKLLAIGVALAVLTTSAVADAGPFHARASLADISADLTDGQLMLAPVGRQGAAIHMSYSALDARSTGHGAGDRQSFDGTRRQAGAPSVFLSVQVPW